MSEELWRDGISREVIKEEMRYRMQSKMTWIQVSALPLCDFVQLSYFASLYYRVNDNSPILNNLYEMQTGSLK